METVSFDGRDDVEYNGVGFVEISQIFSTHGASFFGTEPSLPHMIELMQNVMSWPKYIEGWYNKLIVIDILKSVPAHEMEWYPEYYQVFK